MANSPGRNWESVKPPAHHGSRWRTEEALTLAAVNCTAEQLIQREPHELLQAPKHTKPSVQAPEEEAEPTLGIWKSNHQEGCFNTDLSLLLLLTVVGFFFFPTCRPSPVSLPLPSTACPFPFCLVQFAPLGTTRPA